VLRCTEVSLQTVEKGHKRSFDDVCVASVQLLITDSSRTSRQVGSGANQRHTLRRGKKIGKLDMAQLHELRIGIKKLRYAGEFFRNL